MATIQLPNNWRPRDYQFNAWRYLENGGKRAALVWHRRAGKDDLALHWTATAAIQKPATYWHMLPEYAQGRKAIWEAVNPKTGIRRIDEAFPHAIRKRTDNQTMSIELVNGSMWHVVGSDNYNSLVGSPPYGVIFSEWALADPAAWAYIRPILDENGGWAMWIYTSRGRNHGWSTYQHALHADDWYAELLRADETGIFSDHQLAEARDEYVSLYGDGPGVALFEQEYFCSFDSAVLGAYYSKLLSDADSEGRIGHVPHDDSLQTEVWWDLGVGDATAMWFVQRAGQEIRVIDYYEATGEGLPYYAKLLDQKPYVYSRQVMPHDVRVREMGSGKSRLEVARSLGLTVEIAPRQSLEDGIQAVRSMLPRCWFDYEKCKRGLDALREYRAKYDESRRIFSSRPEHNWASHAADAFRYGAVTKEPADYSDYEPDYPRATGWMY